jgi:hypothetical protein
VHELMDARRAVRLTRKAGDDADEAEAHAAVEAAKRALGERCAVWWDDGAPDVNRHMARTTVYADWFASLPSPDGASDFNGPAPVKPTPLTRGSIGTGASLHRCVARLKSEAVMHQTFDWIFFGIVVPPALAALWELFVLPRGSAEDQASLSAKIWGAEALPTAPREVDALVSQDNRVVV